MGVTGLWQLLSDVGRPVALETLEGKVLAVDVSIWLHQALKGMRDRQGNPVQNAHLISLFNKVCKLLFYRIKPVFVFDGGVPALKKKTLAGRRERKEEAERESQKTAKKMLLNYLKSYAIQQVTGSEPPEPVSLPSTSKSEPDMFNLPAIPLRKESDNESESDDGTYQTQFENLLDIDIDSADFQALPSEMQHEILSEIKDRRKFNYWAQAEDLPEDSNDFSEYQMKKLLKQSKLSSRIEDVRKDMNVQQTGELTGEFGKDLYGSCEVVSRRVVSDDTSRFILVKGLAKKKKQHELAQKKEQQRLEDLRKYFEEIPSDGNSNDSDSASNSKHSRVKNIDLEGNSNDSNSISKFSREENIELDSVSSSISRNKGKNGKNLKVDLTSDVKIKAIDSIDLTESNYDTDNFICSRNSTHTTTEIDHNIRTRASLKSDKLPELTVEELILKRAASPFSEYGAVEKLDECSVSPTKMPKYGTESTDGSSISNFVQEITSTKMLGTTLEKSDVSLRSVSNSDGKDTVDVIPVLVDDEVPYIDVNTSGKVEENLFNSLGKGESFKEKSLTEKSDENQETVSGVGPPDITSPSDKSSVENARIITESVLVEQQITGKTSAKETEEESSFEESAKAIDNNKGLIQNKMDVSEGNETCEQMEGRVSTTTLSSDEEEEDFIEIPELPSAVDSLRNLPAPSMDASFSETTSTAEQDGVATDRGNNSDVELTGSQEESSHYFTSQLKALSEEGVSNLQKELRAESATLQAQRGKQQRQAVSMSDHIYAQAQEMLGMFGLPYLVSPMEAEAQCAYLDLCGLTQGTITDDSDVWLFGGRRVYKNFFNKGKLVEFFRIEDCVAQFGLDRDQLINIALLCGSDYTHGIQGVGPVTAQEILEQFPGPDCLKDLKKWWKKAHKKPVAMSDTKLLAKLRQVKLQPGFPDQQVIEAYLHPEVDDSTEPFSWGIPELDSLRDYMRENLGWPQAKTDEILVPVIKELNKPQTQGRITSFFTPEAHALAQKLKAVKAKKNTTGQKRAAGPKAAKQSMRKRTAPQKPRKPAVKNVVCLSESSSSEESDSSNESSSVDSGSDEFEAVEDIEQSSSMNLKDIKASTSGKLISGNKQRKKSERSTEVVSNDIKNTKNGAAKGKGPSKKAAGTSNSKYSKRALASHMPL